MRNVCVCGWSYEPAFYQALGELPHDEYAVTIVANRKAVCVPTGAKVIERDNIGLEWGAYARYLQHWSGGAVFFLHDDTAATADALGAVFDMFVSQGLDIAFVFNSAISAARNNHHHGRAWIASQPFLLHLVQAGGLWWDMDNHGVTAGAGRNRGANHFFARVAMLLEEDPTLRYGTLIAPDIDLGFRGLLGEDGRAAEARFLSSGAGHAQSADSLAGSLLQPSA